MDLVAIKNLSHQDILDLLGIELTTSRLKCAVLPLEATQQTIKEFA